MKPCTSRELLQKAGVNKPKNPEMPLEIRPLVITSVLNCVPAKVLREALNVGEEVTATHVRQWQKSTREWLRLPRIGRGKPSAEYKELIAEWLAANGNPTPEEIDEGWLPAHLDAVMKSPMPMEWKAILDELRSHEGR